MSEDKGKLSQLTNKKHKLDKAHPLPPELVKNLDEWFKMEEFIEWLHKSIDLHPVTIAGEAHYKLVSIHPFVDGNGRTARLLMNLLLMQTGYPPAIIRKEDRSKYINSIEKAQLGGSIDAFMDLIYRAEESSLDIYLEAIEGILP
jgi:Fic family protein